MHSSSADWVLGEARLISSPSTMLAKIGPGLTSNSRSSWLKALTPVRSPGSRSGVNWTRRTEQSIERASALASSVLPTPGTSSIRMCPSASRTVIASRMASGLPEITVSTASVTRWATGTNSSSFRSASFPVSMTTCPPRVASDAVRELPQQAEPQCLPACRAFRQYVLAWCLRDSRYRVVRSPPDRNIAEIRPRPRCHLANAMRPLCRVRPSTRRPTSLHLSELRLFGPNRLVNESEPLTVEDCGVQWRAVGRTWPQQAHGWGTREVRPDVSRHSHAPPGREGTALPARQVPRRTRARTGRDQGPGALRVRVP